MTGIMIIDYVLENGSFNDSDISWYSKYLLLEES